MIRVLVVDDQDLMRAAFAALVRASPHAEVAGEAADGRQAVDLALQLQPDVVLMDIRLPELDGVAATEEILSRAGEKKPGILVLTIFDKDEYVYAALRAGASGFLLKNSPPETLLAGIEAVARGEMPFSTSVTRRLVETFTTGAPPRPQLPAELSGLTGREVEVLRLVARGNSNADIAQALQVSEVTVKTHLNRTMSKLGISSRAQAVVVAYETGLVQVQRKTGQPF